MKGLRGAAAIWLAVAWAAGVAVPVLALLARAGGGEALAGLLDPSVTGVARVTLEQALLSALLSGALGLPLGLLAGSRDCRAGDWSRFLLALPFGVPAVAAALAWASWLGRAGWLARIFHGLPSVIPGPIKAWLGLAQPSFLEISLDWSFSMKAVVLAHVAFNAPWIALLVADARRHLPRAQLEAALTLGGGRLERFRVLYWPQVRWAFLSGCAQAWALCAMSFAIVLILGGGPPVQTLETSLYSHLRFGLVDLVGAIRCGIWELGISLLPWAAVAWLESRGSEQARDWRVAWELPLRQPSRLRDWAATGLSSLFVLPYLALLAGLAGAGRVLSGDGAQVLSATRISLELAAASSSLAVLSALAAVVVLEGVRRRSRSPGLHATLSALLYLPSGISALVLGLGLWLAYGRWIDPFAGSLAAMAGLQATLFFPIALRMLLPVARQERTRLLEAAATLGASPGTAFRVVEWPRWRSAISGAAILVAGASLGELAAVSLFYSEDRVPLPLLASRWMAQYRFEGAQGVAALLFLLSTGLFGLVYLGPRRRPWTLVDRADRYLRNHG